MMTTSNTATTGPTMTPTGLPVTELGIAVGAGGKE